MQALNALQLQDVLLANGTPSSHACRTMLTVKEISCTDRPFAFARFVHVTVQVWNK